MPNRFKVGVVGFNLSAKVFIVPFVQASHRFDLYGIVQQKSTPVNDAAQLRLDTKAFRKYSDMLHDPQADLVPISSATHTHYELSKLALEGGKNGDIDTNNASP
jgi:predicted dehydrogenase